MRESPSLHVYSVTVRANSAISFGFSMSLLFLEPQLLLALGPEPKTQQDVFFSWYLIATSYPDLGKGSSPPEIRPLCVLGDGNGEAISAIWKLPSGFCHVTLTPLEWLCCLFQRRLEPVVLSRCVRRSIFLISQTRSRLNLRSEQIGLIRTLGFTIR